MHIYFDNSATTQTCQESIDAVLKAFSLNYGNPSSLHRMGFLAENSMNHAREQIAQALGCRAQELYFTSGATESNNLAILGFAEANQRKKHFVTTAIEHPSVSKAFQQLEKKGYSVTYLFPNADGQYTSDQFEHAIREDTAMVSCMLVNNETGYQFPIEDIVYTVKRKQPSVVFHSDIVQAFGKLPLSLKKLPLDMASISGHKLYAPKGIGGLYVKKGIKISPLFFGGGQEKSLRPGTESVPLINGFGAAAEKASKDIEKMRISYKQLNQHLRKSLATIDSVVINTPSNSVDYILNFSVKGIRSEIMLHFLEDHDIYVSSGSACTKGKKSSVLQAMKLHMQCIDSAIRVSFGIYNTIEEIDEFIRCLKIGIKKIMTA